MNTSEFLYRAAVLFLVFMAVMVKVRPDWNDGSAEAAALALLVGFVALLNTAYPLSHD